MSATAQRKRSIFDDSDDEKDDSDSTSSPQAKKKSKHETNEEEEPGDDSASEPEDARRSRQTLTESKKGAGLSIPAISEAPKPRSKQAKREPGRKPEDTSISRQTLTKNNKAEGLSASTISNAVKPRSSTQAKHGPRKSARRGEQKHIVDSVDGAGKEYTETGTSKSTKVNKRAGESGKEDAETIITENTKTVNPENVGEEHIKTNSTSKPIIEAPGTPEKSKAETAETLEKMTLSPAQRARMEQKRQQALMLKQEKLNRKNPYFMKTEEKKDEAKVVRINDTKLIDTGGGFFIEEVEGVSQDDYEAAMQMVTEPVPLFDDERPRCEECGNKFNNSFLFHNFDHPACDDCRDNDDKHALITKTDARNEYLLKDFDLEKREPVLKYIVRKNPHNSRWGDMKLFLKLQIEKRALEVWGSEEALEEALTKKEDQREINKQRKFNRKMQELRMNVRSSLYTRASKTHQHEYGEEEYLPDEDEYSRTCLTCGHSYTYDKL